MKLRCTALLVLMLLALPAAEAWAQANSPQALYTAALARERTLRDAASRVTLQQLRAGVAAYESIVRRFPRSGYSDNALWQGGNLAIVAYERFGQEADKRTAIRLLNVLKSQYPSSSLVPRVDGALRLAENARPPAPARAQAKPAAPTAPAPASKAPPASREAASTAPNRRVSIRDVARSPIPGGVRVTIEMDDETAFHVERLDDPARVFFDLPGTEPVAGLRDASLRFEDDVVREVRLGRHPQNTTRVVMDMEGVEDYSVFTLYDPFRLVVDFKALPALARSGAPAPGGPTPAVTPAAANAANAVLDWAVASPPPAAPPPAASTVRTPAPTATSGTAELKTLPTPPLTAPEVPTANANGTYSLARQLGLGISRIVIDAGHGGRDPGTMANGLRESELVLDVARRLAARLRKDMNIDVVMTRDTDVFIDLEERTAIANRAGADLFLSIHANSARNLQARGVETYFLNFATDPEAEAVAARENATSSRRMHQLPNIVRAIALNNKINESRDFADTIQRAMVQGLAARNQQVIDRGVKQAPFVVLIGAEMPSVLAEISFLTNKQDAALLQTPAYRQQIADSLFLGIQRYQQSVKKMKSPSTTSSAR
ncbi:MAG: N-acetylmuramoyl-L-alanine amidase [Acidobacteria bacterium]|nr:N-acetylmuramoyl-L-alanine amidase [Acidobacteriota bacterium]MBA3886680.1 N-acetylmuramoyl-L-alanine amidase [Acidobacteriota bacterium]